MAEFPAFTIWIDRYHGATGHLTTVQHGAYLLLLFEMWRNGGVLPNDEKILARIARLPLDKWRKMSPTMMAFMETDGQWITQPRLVKELKRARQHRARQSAGAKAMWLKRQGAADTRPYGAVVLDHMPPDSTLVSKKITTSEYDAAEESGKREEKSSANGKSESIAVSPALAAKYTRQAMRH